MSEALAEAAKDKPAASDAKAALEEAKLLRVQALSNLHKQTNTVFQALEAELVSASTSEEISKIKARFTKSLQLERAQTQKIAADDMLGPISSEELTLASIRAEAGQSYS